MANRSAVRRQPVSRRAFLQSAGVAMGLPWLDAMVPAFATPAQAAAATEPPRRFIAMHYGLGFHGPHLFPDKPGRDYALTPYLEPLAEFRGQYTIFSGVSHPDQRGANGHTSEMTWLTGGKHPGLPGFRNTISLDQLMAEQLGPQTRFPYLALNVGGSDSLSWTSNGINLPAESSPAKVFQQLFVNGTPQQVKEQLRDLQRGRSILDTVRQQATKFNRTLGPRDQEKLDQYLTAVRQLETRLQQSEGWANKPKPTVPVKPPTDIQDRTDIIGRTRLMHDLLLLALQNDSTRIVTYRAGGMNAVPKIDGVDEDWHNLSHHGLDPEKIDELKLIELAEFREIARFLGLLQGAKEGSASLLDRTVVLVGSNLGNASSHSTENMPVLVAGGGFRHGQHLLYDRKNNTPLCNLFVQIAERMGLPVDRFGSSSAGGMVGFDLA